MAISEEQSNSLKESCLNLLAGVCKTVKEYADADSISQNSSHINRGAAFAIYYFTQTLKLSCKRDEFSFTDFKTFQAAVGAVIDEELVTYIKVPSDFTLKKGCKLLCCLTAVIFETRFPHEECVDILKLRKSSSYVMLKWQEFCSTCREEDKQKLRSLIPVMNEDVPFFQFLNHVCNIGRYMTDQESLLKLYVACKYYMHNEVVDNYLSKLRVPAAQLSNYEAQSFKVNLDGWLKVSSPFCGSDDFFPFFIEYNVYKSDIDVKLATYPKVPREVIELMTFLMLEINSYKKSKSSEEKWSIGFFLKQGSFNARSYNIELADILIKLFPTLLSDLNDMSSGYIEYIAGKLNQEISFFCGYKGITVDSSLSDRIMSCIKGLFPSTSVQIIATSPEFSRRPLLCMSDAMVGQGLSPSPSQGVTDSTKLEISREVVPSSTSYFLPPPKPRNMDEVILANDNFGHFTFGEKMKNPIDEVQGIFFAYLPKIGRLDHYDSLSAALDILIAINIHIDLEHTKFTALQSCLPSGLYSLLEGQKISDLMICYDLQSKDKFIRENAERPYLALHPVVNDVSVRENCFGHDNDIPVDVTVAEVSANKEIVRHVESWPSWVHFVKVTSYQGQIVDRIGFSPKPTEEMRFSIRPELDRQEIFYVLKPGSQHKTGLLTKGGLIIGCCDLVSDQIMTAVKEYLKVSGTNGIALKDLVQHQLFKDLFLNKIFSNLECLPLSSSQECSCTVPCYKV